MRIVTVKPSERGTFRSDGMISSVLLHDSYEVRCRSGVSPRVAHRADAVPMTGLSGDFGGDQGRSAQLPDSHHTSRTLSWLCCEDGQGATKSQEPGARSRVQIPDMSQRTGHPRWKKKGPGNQRAQATGNQLARWGKQRTTLGKSFF